MMINQHWLSQARRVLSPNFDDRPDPDDISLIVIHCISLPPGQFGTDCINQLFCNCLNPEQDPYFRDIYQLKVSSHILITRDGSLVQYVSFDKRAWHAGLSSFQGRERCNDFSIGIELEGTENIPYEQEQYQQLAMLTKSLLSAYPTLSQDRITGHSDIAPGRKNDPGASFDWQRYYNLLKE